jgi:hypothetical protein
MFARSKARNVDVDHERMYSIRKSSNCRVNANTALARQYGAARQTPTDQMAVHILTMLKTHTDENATTQTTGDDSPLQSNGNSMDQRPQHTLDGYTPHGLNRPPSHIPQCGSRVHSVYVRFGGRGRVQNSAVRSINF